VGDEIEKEVTPTGFGRVAAQYAKQALMQKVPAGGEGDDLHGIQRPCR